MDTVNAALLNAVRALFLSEAGAVAGEGLGKLVLRNDLVDELAYHGVLAGADEVEVFALNFVHHSVHFGLTHNALNNVATDHKRRDAVGKALVYHEVTRIGKDCRVQAGNVSHEIIEAVAGDAACGVHIDAVEALHYLGMIRNIKIGDHWLAKALDFNVCAVIRADGNGGIDDVRNGQHDLMDALCVVLLETFKLSEPVGLSLDLRLDLFSLLKL